MSTKALAAILVTAVVGGMTALAAPGAGAATGGGIAAGSGHTCAVMADTSARCWGSNAGGQLGGVTSSVPVPFPVTTATGVAVKGIVQIAAGFAHTCARFANGTARCWGSNTAGQVGDGSTINRAHPVFVRRPDGTPFTGVTAIAAGGDGTCARLADSTVWCWGLNSLGQLGDGTTTNRSRPGPVITASGAVLTGVSSIDVATTLACARLTIGQARCWGFNAYSQLGDGTTVSSARAVVVLNSDRTPLTGIAQVTSGGLHTCARFANGTARCWGLGRAGQLGDGAVTNRTTPVFVRPTSSSVLTGITELAAGQSHTCARLGSGQVRCWGANDYGQLGDGTATPRSRPTTVATAATLALTGATSVAAASGHTCARLVSGQLRCWGSNAVGNLGDGSTTSRSRPVVVVGGPLVGLA